MTDTTTTTKPLLRLDSSILGDTNCILQYLLKGYYGYTDELQGQALVVGSAVHIFIEEYLKTKDEVLAKVKALKYFKDTPFQLDHKKKYQDSGYLARVFMECLTALEDEPYSSMQLVNKPSAPNEPLLELNFSIPFYTDDWVEINLTGTIDSIWKIPGGCYLMNDWKTTTFHDKEKVFAPYKLSTQLMTYCWALKWFAESSEVEEKNPKASELYREMFNSKNRIGCSISGIFMAGAVKDPELVRSDIVWLSDTKLEVWERGVMAICRRISAAIRGLAEGSVTVNDLKEGFANHACAGNWGRPCFAFNACVNDSENVFWTIMNSSYTKRNYNPLMFRK